MDKEYIKMCRAATELQDVWEPKSGDRIQRTHTVFGYELDRQIWDSMESVDILISETSNNFYWRGCNLGSGKSVILTRDEMYKTTCVWLPWQEDIQKLYKKRCKVAYDGDVYLLFNDWVKKSLKHCDLSFNEMWLCFYMETCHNERWDNEKGVWKVKP